MLLRTRHLAVLVSFRVLVALGLILVPQLGYATPSTPQFVQEEEEKEKEQEQKRADSSRHTPPPLPRSPRTALGRSEGLLDLAQLSRIASDAGLGRAAALDHFRNGLGTPPRC